MTTSNRGRDLDAIVQQWLQQQSPYVHFIADKDQRSQSGDLPSADFLILRPLPIAVITSVNSTGAAIRMKEKRFLAQRIALAERFGNQLPVVIIVPEGTETATVRFADKVLVANELPSIEKLCSQLKLNPEVQTILKEGEPSDVQFSSDDDIKRHWARAISLLELANSQTVFPSNSLAHRLQEVLVPIKAAAGESGSAGEVSSSPQRAGSKTLKSAANADRRSVPWHLSPRWSEAFDSVLFKFIEERCGGHVESKRHREQIVYGQIIRHVWRSKAGKRVVVRRFTVGEGSVAHRSRELIAEAWMTRAFLEPNADAQILLAGVVGQEPALVQTISGPKVQERNSPRLWDINALEAAGWLVAPWDFAEEEPRFIKLLREVSA
jgi:hypothetical protein